MKRLFVALILIGCMIGAVATLRAQPPNAGLPIVQTAAPSCPRLANPCDRVNCNRPDTRRIA